MIEAQTPFDLDVEDHGDATYWRRVMLARLVNPTEVGTGDIVATGIFVRDSDRELFECAAARGVQLHLRAIFAGIVKVKQDRFTVERCIATAPGSASYHITLRSTYR